MVYKLGIATHSLGRAWVHEMPAKLDEAERYAYEGVEVFYEDLEYLAKTLPRGLNSDNLLTAAQNLRSMLDARSIDVICLQPFMHYEGLVDRKVHEERIEQMKLWFKLAKILRTDIIGIPSNFLPESEGEITGDKEICVADLRKIADMGMEQAPEIKFAYEAICWGRYVSTWEQSWEMVQAVNMPNFGLCLDTFNITGKCYADPSREDGKIENADQILKESLERMVKEVDVNKVFFVQVVDAERLRNPLTSSHVFHVEGQPCRMSWSRNCRLFPFEKAGYLPIVDVLKAITEGLGYQGWLSFELFSRTMADPDEKTPREHARRGLESWGKMVTAMGWEKKVAKKTLGAVPSSQAPVVVSTPTYGDRPSMLPVAGQEIMA